MRDVDDIVSSWERRNADKLAEEREQRLRDRVILFTRVELMRAVLATAVYRTSVAFQLPLERMRATLVPDPDTKRFRPAIEIDAQLECDEDGVRQVFEYAVRELLSEWRDDVAFAEHDARAWAALVAAAPKETAAEFQARLRSWVQ